MAELIDVDIVRNTPDRKRGENIHPHHELLLMRDGPYEVQTADQHYHLQPGDAIAFPAHFPHWPLLNADARTHYYVLTWHGKFPSDREISFHHNLDRLQFLMPWLWRAHQSGDDEQVPELFNLILTELGRQQSSQQRTPVAQTAGAEAKIALAQAYMKQNFHRNVDMTELSQLCHWSPEHLTRTFKAITGQTPNNCLQEMRIEAAIALLKSTHLSAQEICEQVGFQSLPHLQKLIKRQCGMTMKKLRE